MPQKRLCLTASGPKRRIIGRQVEVVKAYTPARGLDASSSPKPNENVRRVVLISNGRWGLMSLYVGSKIIKDSFSID